MDIYLPIAGQSVNALFIVVLGFLVGLLSGMFGVGGGFLTTPLLIFYGIPPTVAVASAATQITGASVSGVMVHMRRGGVDMKMGGVMIAGGFLGSIVGAALFRLLQASGPLAVVIGGLAVLSLGWSGSLILGSGHDGKAESHDQCQLPQNRSVKSHLCLHPQNQSSCDEPQAKTSFLLSCFRESLQPCKQSGAAGPR